LRDTFSPTIAVLTSEDAEIVCQKNDLSFVEMIRPFCQLSNDVYIRDPVNPNLVVPIKNLKINVRNLETPSPPSQLVSRILSEVVAKSVTNVDLKTHQSLEMLQNAITPWFEAYRSCFFQLLKPLEHEFIRHILACMIVVSTQNPDPMGAFVAINAKQAKMQQTADNENAYVKWFSPHTFKYYVLLHDASEGHEFKADAVFQSMKSVYGSHTCFMLQINSRSKMYPDAPEVDNTSDPWSVFIYPFADDTLDIKDEDLDDDSESEMLPPLPKTQAEADKEEERILEDFERAEKMANEPNFVNPTMNFQDPLTSMHYNESLENDSDLGPLKPAPPDLVKDIPQYKRRLSKVKLNEYKKCIRQFTFEMLPQSARGKETKKRGQQLTLLDHDRIKALMYEFCVRGLLPHIEKQMRSLSEQILSRKGIHRSIFNVTKKWFGGGKSSIAVNSFSSAPGASSSYPLDSIELQQRKLGDLAFMVQHYELAFNSYHAAKREFNNDHAWVYFAGALEMAAIAAFMQGPSKSYRPHYFDACISTYLNTCRLPDYATRACLMSTEAFKARGMFADAAFEFIKLTNEECELRSALLLEQAAHCYLHNNPPMIRKYAFHMILAGHRYSKAAQRKHTLRCYTNALNVYKEKGWHLAEDHMNFIIGRQCFNLGQLEDSQDALRKLLTYQSFQLPLQQASHLREFLAVFKQVIEKQSRHISPKASESIPTLPLPVIDGQASRVILSSTTLKDDQSCDTPTIENPAVDINRTRTIVAGQYSFRRNYNKSYFQRWSSEEKQTVEEITGSSRYPWRPSIPFLCNATDNSCQPICIAGETISLEVVFVNPLKIPLNLLDLHLLWEFTPSTSNDKENTTISNTVKDFPQCITTDVIENSIVKALERKSVPLNLKFHETGTLKVIGVSYILSSISVINAVDEEGKVDLNGVQKSTLLNFGVKGQQEITLKGPRLNGTKSEKTNIVYGVDYRLNPRVLPAVPRLQAWMINFPVTLLCGEVRLTQFVFRNIGRTALKNLYISCNRPECFSLDGQMSDSDMIPKDAIYETFDGGPIHHSVADIPAPDSQQRTVKVPLEYDLLQPNAEISVPIWIHGISTSGVHELDFLFYYEPQNHVPDIPYRVLYQTVRLQTLSTLELFVRLRQSSTDHFKEESEDTRTVEQSLFGLHIENKAQGSAFPRCVEFTVLQVSCFSNGMKFNCVGKGSTSSQRLRPGEALLMYLKASKDTHDDSSQQTVSHISFTENMIDSGKSPAIDFFSKSSPALGILDSNQPLSARIGIVIFWQTSYIDDSCVRHIIYGQTHSGVRVDASLQKNFRQQKSLNSTFPSIEYDIFDGRSQEKDLNNMCRERPSIHASLCHLSALQHNFKANCICTIPVSLTVSNSNEREVTVMVRAKNFAELSNEFIVGEEELEHAVLKPKPESEQRDYYENGESKRYRKVAAWIGKTCRKITLQPFVKERLMFKAVVVCPGTFNLNIFEFNVTNNDNDIEIKNSSDESVIRVFESSHNS